jgi:hypothetical protein
MVVTKFLTHKDACQLPDDEEFVKVGGRVGIVVDIHDPSADYPMYEVQMPSGRSNVFRAAEITRLSDQNLGRQKFYE